MGVERKLKFSVEKVNSVKIEEDSRFAVLDIDICRSGNNCNGIPFTREAIERSMETLYPCPVLFKVNRWGDDFMGHEVDEEIGGTFLKDTATTFEENGDIWLNAKAVVYKAYCPHIVNILQKKGNETDVSMEINATAFENINGQEYVSDFVFNGVTLLGVKPAITGAKAKMMAFSCADDVAEEYRKEVFMRSRYDELDLSIPQDVKESVQKFLDEHKDGKYSGVSKASLAIARYLSANEKIDVAKLNKMNDFFTRYSNERYKHNDMAYACHGGEAGNRWVSALMEQVNEIDSTPKVTFAEGNKETEELGNDDGSEKGASKKMGNIFEKNEGSEFFAELNGREIYDAVIAKVQEKLGQSFYVRTIYDDHIIVENEDDKKVYRIEADIKAGEDDKNMEIDIKWDTQKEEQAEAEPNDDDDHDDDDDKDDDEYFNGLKCNGIFEKDIQTMSDEDMDVYLKEMADVAEKFAKVEMSDLESKKFEKVVELACDMAKFAGAMKEACDKLSAKNEELKKFKDSEETKQKQFVIDSTMASVKESLDEKEFNEMEKDASNYSFADINVWKNKVKSFAFDKMSETNKETQIQRYAWGESKGSETKSCWD